MNQRRAPDLTALGGEGYVGAVDLGGTKILTAIVAPDGHTASRAIVLVGKDHTPASVVDKMAECVRNAIAEAGIDVKQLRAVGVGAPGPVQHDTGVVVHAPNLGWHNFPLKAELERRLEIPVAVENDVRVAVLAEHALGAGRGVRNWVGVWPGTGIGGGVVIDGALWRGASNAAGEIGHMTIKAGGPMCGCGARGHLEALASRTGIVHDIQRQVARGKKTILSDLVGDDLSIASGADLGKAWAQRDPVVSRAIERAAEYLAIGIASIANVVNPELIVFGGGVTEGLGDRFLARIERKLRGQPMVAATDPLRLVRCELGDDAGIAGAALVARRLAASRPVMSGER